MSAAPEEGEHADRDHDEHEAPEDPQVQRHAAGGQRHQADDAEAEQQDRDDQGDDDEHAADPRQGAGALGRGHQAHELQPAQLAVGGRLDAEPLGGLLEIVGPALGQGQRRVGHAPQLQALLRAGRGDRPLEVGPGGLGVIALGRAGAENGLRGGLELGLGLELLVAAALHLLHGGQLAALLDAHGSLLLGHERESSAWA